MARAREKLLHENLVELGPDKLASLLIEITSKNPEAKEVIDRALSSPQDNLKRFRKRLSALKRRKGFVSWRESGKYAENLISILEDIREDNPDHKTCLEGIGLFYGFDNVIFEQCDDSNGTIGDVFRITAAELFRHHASQYDDKEWICNWIIELNSSDGYGVKDHLFDDLKKFLSEQEIKTFAEKVRKRALRETGEWEKRCWYRNLATIAIQLQDVDLYKLAKIEGSGELYPGCYLEIAKIHYSKDEYEKALEQLELTINQKNIAAECKELRLKIYQKLGNDKEAEKIVLDNFRKSRSMSTLEDVHSYLKEEQIQKFIDSEVKSICYSKEFSMQDLNFLIELNCLDKAEEYVLRLKDQVNGDWYYAILPISKNLEHKGSLLAASVCYRALVDSVLERAKSKTYHHAISYLKRLDKIATKIDDWKSIESHIIYKEKLKKSHKLKYSFWNRYG